MGELEMWSVWIFFQAASVAAIDGEVFFVEGDEPAEVR